MKAKGKGKRDSASPHRPGHAVDHAGPNGREGLTSPQPAAKPSKPTKSSSGGKEKKAFGKKAKRAAVSLLSFEDEAGDADGAEFQVRKHRSSGAPLYANKREMIQHERRG